MFLRFMFARLNNHEDNPLRNSSTAAALQHRLLSPLSQGGCFETGDDSRKLHFLSHLISRDKNDKINHCKLSKVNKSFIKNIKTSQSFITSTCIIIFLFTSASEESWEGFCRRLLVTPDDNVLIGATNCTSEQQQK